MADRCDRFPRFEEVSHDVQEVLVIAQKLRRSPTGDESSGKIARVDIARGESKPVRITVNMTNTSGLFQVEEVLMTKVKASPIMGHLEIVALVEGQEPKYYLS